MRKALFAIHYSLLILLTSLCLAACGKEETKPIDNVDTDELDAATAEIKRLQDELAKYKNK